MGVSKMMIVRTIVLVIALVNQALVLTGKSVLPWSNEEIEQGVTAIFTVVAAAWAWWKNNSVTEDAKLADEILHELKQKNKK